MQLSYADKEEIASMTAAIVIAALERKSLVQRVSISEYAHMIGRTPQTIRNKIKAYNVDLYEMGIFPDKTGKYTLTDLNKALGRDTL